MQQPDDSQRQIELLRSCSGNKSIISFWQGKHEQPLEDLLEAKAQPNYQQFIQGLPKI